MENTKTEKNTSLVNIISTVIQFPGIKVNRDSFLRNEFKDKSPELLNLIIEKGPIEANCSKKELQKIARKIVNHRTLASTGASFLAGIPGGFAMAATIPADMIQFYAVALGLAQEIAYLYGECDFWSGDMLDTEKVTNQLLLYCGVMLGASGAAQTIRVLSSSLAKQALKKLPQQALTKTFYYPIVKSIAKALGAKMTKEVFAKGVSKAVPIIGGVVSGGITFTTLRPMGLRLAETFEEAHFSYTDADFEVDWNNIVEVCENEEATYSQPLDVDNEEIQSTKPSTSSVLDKIKEAKQMFDDGIITDEEFTKIKENLIVHM